MKKLNKLNIGFALTGSFCTFSKAMETLKELQDEGHNIFPIMSFNAFSTDTRFGKAEFFRTEAEKICSRPVISTICKAEPIGPQKLLDILIIEPCTGNTLAKLSSGITDTPVTLAAKAHLRNARPLLIAVSTNDALSGTAKNIGNLLNYKNIYFVPFNQDDADNKPASMVSDFSKTKDAMYAALNGKQLQPIIYKSSSV